jgi:hypothetical protein
MPSRKELDSFWVEEKLTHVIAERLAGDNLITAPIILVINHAGDLLFLA